MKKLLLAFLLTAFVGACGNSTSDDGTFDYPFNEQTWKVNSAEQADWVGSSSPQKVLVSTMADSSDSTGTDTTFIDQPDKFGLNIFEHAAIDSAYIIQFIDSTITSSNYDSLGLGPQRADSLFDMPWDGGGASFNSDRVTIDYRYKFDCGDDHQQEDALNVYWLDDSLEDTARTYTVNISGALETVNHIKCES